MKTLGNSLIVQLCSMQAFYVDFDTHSNINIAFITLCSRKWSLTAMFIMFLLYGVIYELINLYFLYMHVSIQDQPEGKMITLSFIRPYISLCIYYLPACIKLQIVLLDYIYSTYSYMHTPQSHTQTQNNNPHFPI